MQTLASLTLSVILAGGIAAAGHRTVGLVPSLCGLQRLAEPLARRRDRVRARRNLAQLCELDGGLLRDIGVDRGELRYQAFGPRSR